jgi:PLP dependent protein
VPATLEDNLRATLDSLADAARGAGRDPGEVTLLAVTKSVGPRTTEELVRLGQRDLGENRLESLTQKRDELRAANLPVTWHFIGHVQRNKARKVVRNSEVIHSVDSLRLIDTLERIAEEEERRPEIYLEVKLSGEERKHGLPLPELSGAIRRAGEAPHLDLVGLMTMGPLPMPGGDPEESALPVFEELARLGAELHPGPGFADRSSGFAGKRVRLSMGMSGDFRAAIASGSDVVRIGSALFEGITTDDAIQGVRR